MASRRDFVRFFVEMGILQVLLVNKETYFAKEAALIGERRPNSLTDVLG